MIILDTESHPNLFLASFLDADSGDLVEVLSRSGPLHGDDRAGILGILEGSTTCSFNGLGYDLPLLALAAGGADVARIKAVSDAIVSSDRPAYSTCRDLGIAVPGSWDHIDLMRIAPGTASLKLYGARLGSRSVRDLPYRPDRILTDPEVEDVRSYCRGDLRTTLDLLGALEGEIALRRSLGEAYGLDLRSDPDATIAERVLLREAGRPAISARRRRPDAHSFLLRDPGVSFRSEGLRSLLGDLLRTPFSTNAEGRVVLPTGLEGRSVSVGGTAYRVGIGGLHSDESRRTLRSGAGGFLEDLDVASFYPSIILSAGLAPPGVGSGFLAAYRRILRRRLAAKGSGDRTAADSLKIVLNAAFGKFGNRHSTLFSPEAFAQVTVTGRLLLLSLIERLEAVGIRVVSANTDGVVALCPGASSGDLDREVWGWMLDTGMELVRTRYRLLAQRDVNSYVAVTEGGNLKRKGAFASPGLWRNPNHPVVADAAVALLAAGVPIADTVASRSDARGFLAARRVTGGASWRGEPLGRVARWYLSSDVPRSERILYASNGNAVPGTDGARPCQMLPDGLPSDLDLARYMSMAEDLLRSAGALEPRCAAQARLFT